MHYKIKLRQSIRKVAAQHHQCQQQLLSLRQQWDDERRQDEDESMLGAGIGLRQDYDLYTCDEISDSQKTVLYLEDMNDADAVMAPKLGFCR